MAIPPPTSVPPRSWTLDDLMALPEDGRRYELIDGSLHVSPPPVPRHQVVATAMLRLLHAAAPADLLVLAGGAGVHRSPVGGPAQFLVPDVLVVRRASVDAADRGFAPADVVLAVEVVSPSSVTTDLVTKRDLYARLRLPHYWIVEVEPLIRVRLLRLEHEAYVVDDAVGAGDRLDVTRPFPLTLRPETLLS